MNDIIQSLTIGYNDCTYLHQVICTYSETSGLHATRQHLVSRSKLNNLNLKLLLISDIPRPEYSEHMWPMAQRSLTLIVMFCFTFTTQFCSFSQLNHNANFSNCIFILIDIYNFFSRQRVVVHELLFMICSLILFVIYHGMLLFWFVFVEIAF